MGGTTNRMSRTAHMKKYGRNTQAHKPRHRHSPADPASGSHAISLTHARPLPSQRGLQPASAQSDSPLFSSNSDDEIDEFESPPTAVPLVPQPAPVAVSTLSGRKQKALALLQSSTPNDAFLRQQKRVAQFLDEPALKRPRASGQPGEAFIAAAVPDLPLAEMPLFAAPKEVSGVNPSGAPLEPVAIPQSHPPAPALGSMNISSVHAAEDKDDFSSQAHRPGLGYVSSASQAHPPISSLINASHPAEEVHEAYSSISPVPSPTPHDSHEPAAAADDTSEDASSDPLSTFGIPLLHPDREKRPWAFLEDLAAKLGLPCPDFNRKPEMRFLIPEIDSHLLRQHYDGVPKTPIWPTKETSQNVGLEWRLGFDYEDCLPDSERNKPTAEEMARRSARLEQLDDDHLESQLSSGAEPHPSLLQGLATHTRWRDSDHQQWRFPSYSPSLRRRSVLSRPARFSGYYDDNSYEDQDDRDMVAEFTGNGGSPPWSAMSASSNSDVSESCAVEEQEMCDDHREPDLDILLERLQQVKHEGLPWVFKGYDRHSDLYSDRSHNLGVDGWITRCTFQYADVETFLYKREEAAYATMPAAEQAGWFMANSLEGEDYESWKRLVGADSLPQPMSSEFVQDDESPPPDEIHLDSLTDRICSGSHSGWASRMPSDQYFMRSLPASQEQQSFFALPQPCHPNDYPSLPLQSTKPSFSAAPDLASTHPAFAVDGPFSLSF